MIKRQDLVHYLDDFLACDNYQDYAPNGLQVEGTEAIHTICTAVTASQDVIEQAIVMRADALLVHHGYFWRGETQSITGMKKKRINGLLSANINLFAYHLPLDCHPEIGNNACLGRLFDTESTEMHVAGRTPDLLWTGQLPRDFSLDEFSVWLTDILKRTPISIKGSEKKINRIAWCSGGAQDFIHEAKALGVDAYISGEISERTYYEARELGLHYLSCGHHATERYGIQALGEKISSQFDLKHVFLDSNNPV